MRDLSGNLGNWGEIYALLDVLIGKSIKGTSPIAGDFNYFDYEITDARRTVGGKEMIITHGDHGTVHNSLNQIEMSYAQLAEAREAVQTAMANHERGRLTVPKATPFTDFLEIGSLGTGSEKKTDLELGIRDPTTGVNVVSKFSVKTLVGKAPTLLNASQATNFEYIVHGIDSHQVDELNAINDKQVWLENRLAKLLQIGGRLEYSGVWNRRQNTRARSPFHENLRMIDSSMPEIMGEALLRWKLHGERSLDEVPSSLVAPLAANHGLILTESQIRFKIACLLEASALGMNPDTDWDGKYAVSDGMLIVDKDFSTRLIRTRTHDGFREALLRSTRFEMASGHRHKFGDFYTENGQTKVKLNLQIRYDSPGGDEAEEPSEPAPASKSD